MQTDLNLDIDCLKTARKVTNFLDKKLDRYLALSGKQRFDLKSPGMDGMPKAPSHGNGSENRMLNIWLAEEVVDCVGCAMRNMTKESQRILLSRYSDQMMVYKIAQELNYSASTYTRRQEKALCEFADRFEFQIIRHGIHTEVADLHVYKNEH
ncbi:ArpU family transcriptional regulator [Limosilactobacillus reuteri]|uniref:ArpU family transcriptional regulator n=1 Tax=Limosilactobacillus reuteri TaxID=1598 RepID=A0A1Y2US22_LIMRT|nr:ArpU family phage packaging/lysis transcriptional regulator [Limosilactobacillus reuteri]MCC4389420.1 ArpU family transcriptional regulator [Limosilactobacillus reuteri]MCC4391230.1 ArpU family transcriptional regulator [Limosilactobacillus reuteri]MCC4428158.1 ArpU family transcriptional regulator [Limosilactobacillus reuteri]MCC4432013.1 ArpU family transcriptional regulator [Limosilactobacillus reuteri]MCC4434059.1 ArpU family transcriptional regulator [Limosilactobacillus reuteri]